MSALLERFPDTGIKGSAGEIKVLEYLHKKYYNVSDYRYDMSVQKQGVDFGFSNKDYEREITLDVKSNLYIKTELIGFKLELSKRNQPGWLHTSKADYIFHVCTYKNVFLTYKLSDMRNYIFDNKNNLEFVKYNNDELIQLYISHSNTNGIPCSNLYHL